MEQEQNKNKSWITEGLLIASVPFLGYLISYLYEKGFCSVFDIPYQFISLNVNAIFFASGSLIFFAISYLLFIDNVSIFIVPYYKKDDLIWNEIALFAPFWAFGIGIIAIYGSAWKEWLPFFIPIIIVTILDFGFPLFRKDKKTYLEKFKAQVEIDKSVHSLTSLFLRGKVNKEILFIILALISFFTFSYSLGRSNALKQKEYLVTNENKPRVVLRIYDNKLILVPLSKNTVKKIFSVQELAEDPKLELILEKIGPLHTETTATSTIGL